MAISADALTRVLSGRSAAVLSGDGSVAIQAITHDSRLVRPGALFCCVPGALHDGHDFAAAAAADGAAALLVERLLDTPAGVAALPQIQVPSVRAAMGPAAAEVFDRPSEHLDLIGVTGTNGKTSVVHLLGSVLASLGLQAETLGTLSGERTTPEGPELQATFADWVSRRVQAGAIEVSSHALAMRRVDGSRFRAAVFTNLGHDHLDYHETMPKYLAAKARLFSSEFTATSILNLDDPAGLSLAETTDTDVIGYSLADAGEIRTEGPISRFALDGHEVVLRLAGLHNVENALAAAAVARHLGYEASAIADALCAVSAPRGRFEFVNVGQPFHVIVDYAHKPEALSAVLSASRHVAKQNRVIVVVGCGGDRDKLKRPMMGKVAVQLSDLAILTSDNPRTEDPDAIIASMVEGSGRGPEVLVEPDRRVAIEVAIAAAQPGDVVLVAGRGHETYQVVGDQSFPFDDREVAIDSLGSSASLVDEK